MLVKASASDSESTGSFNTANDGDTTVFECEYLNAKTQMRVTTGAGFRKYMADEEVQNDNTKDVDVT